MSEKGYGAYIAEFVGTLVLVLATTGFVSASPFTGLDLLGLAVVHAIVTLALPAKMFFLGRGSLVNYGAPGISDTYLQGGSVWLAFLAEAIGAFLLMWAVMGTAVNPNAPKGVAGVAIGGALALGVLIFGPATGASFNPARWFGPAVAAGQWDDFWLYILAPIAGALGATYTYLAVMRTVEPPLPTQSPRRGESAEPPVAV